MSTKVYWFNLPATVKEVVANLEDPLTCLVGDINIGRVTDELGWFRYPEKITALIEAINEEINVPYTPPENINWFNAKEQTQLWVAYMESLTVAVCA